MFYSQLCLPDGSSVLLDGVVGGVTGISIPRENMTETQRKISFIIICICMYLCCCVDMRRLLQDVNGHIYYRRMKMCHC